MRIAGVRLIHPNVLLAVSLGVAACVHAPARPLDLPGNARLLAQQSLGDAALQQRLQTLHLAQPGGINTQWDRAQLLVVATERNPKLRVARAQLQAASAAITTARALPNPTLSLGGEYDLSQAAESPWLWSLTTDWLLDAGLRRKLRVQLAQTQLQAARLDYAEAVWTARSELRAALLSYLLAVQRQSLLNMAVADEEQLLVLQRQRTMQGEAAASDSLPIELELARARASLSDNTRSQALALAQVAQALGMPVGAVQSTSFSWPELIHVVALDEVMVNRWRDQALLSRGDLERAVQAYQSRELELQQAVRQQYPQLSIGPGYTWDHGIKKATLGLSFSLPLFNHNQGPVAEAEAQRNAAGEQALAVQQQVLSEIDLARQTYQTAVQMLEPVLQQSDSTAASLQQALHAHSLGVADQASVIAARLLANAQSLVVLDAVEKMQQALGQLEDALRTPLSGPEMTMLH